MADTKYAKWFEIANGVTVPKAEHITGDDEEEKKELDQWLDQFEKELLPLIESNDKKLTPALHKVNKSLLSLVFLVSNHVTLADLVFYVKLHPLVAQWNEKERLIFVALTRWFDHIQHLVSRDGDTSKIPPLIEINTNIPYEPKKPAAKPAAKQAAEPKKGQEKKGKQPHEPTPLPENPEKEEEKKEHLAKLEELGVNAISTEHSATALAAASSTASSSTTPSEQPQKPEQPKKGEGKGKGKQPQQPQEGKGKKPAQAAATPAPALSATEDVSRLDIRVGKIITCKKHENADSLYIEEIDVGEEAPRQVVSGLVKFVPLDEMQNRSVLLLCNLKPSNLKGVRSQAMVLAASNADHTQVELVDPPAGAKIGERVTFEGFPGDPEKVLKKETLDIVLKDLSSNGDKVATYKGVPFTTSAGVCVVKSIANGGIR